MAARKLKGAVRSKMINLGLLLTILGAVQANIDVFGEFLSPMAQGLVTMGVGIAVVVLRWITDEGLDEK